MHPVTIQSHKSFTLTINTVRENSQTQRQKAAQNYTVFPKKKIQDTQKFHVTRKNT